MSADTLAYEGAGTVGDGCAAGSALASSSVHPASPATKFMRLVVDAATSPFVEAQEDADARLRRKRQKAAAKRRQQRQHGGSSKKRGRRKRSGTPRRQSRKSRAIATATLDRKSTMAANIDTTAAMEPCPERAAAFAAAVHAQQAAVAGPSREEIARMVKAFPSWALVFGMPVSQDVQQRALRKHNQWKQDKAKEAVLKGKSVAAHCPQRKQQQQHDRPLPAPTTTTTTMTSAGPFGRGQTSPGHVEQVQAEVPATSTFAVLAWRISTVRASSSSQQVLVFVRRHLIVMVCVFFLACAPVLHVEQSQGRPEPTPVRVETTAEFAGSASVTAIRQPPPPPASPSHAAKGKASKGGGHEQRPVRSPAKTNAGPERVTAPVRRATPVAPEPDFTTVPSASATPVAPRMLPTATATARPQQQAPHQVPLAAEEEAVPRAVASVTPVTATPARPARQPTATAVPQGRPQSRPRAPVVVRPAVRVLTPGHEEVLPSSAITAQVQVEGNIGPHTRVCLQLSGALAKTFCTDPLTPTQGADPAKVGDASTNYGRIMPFELAGLTEGRYSMTTLLVGPRRKLARDSVQFSIKF